MKKNIILMVGLMLVSAIFCMPAFALEGKYGPYSYEVKKNGDLKITAFDWNLYGDEDVYIPKMIDGYSVTEIGDSAFSNAKSKAVAVIIPDTIVTIGEKAFFETSITTMHIPASVLSIGDGAFAGCKNIRQFSVDSSNARYAQIDGVLYNKIDKELVAFPNNNYDFSIPEGIVSIAPYAFYQSNLGIIYPPSTLISIGAYAFKSSKIGGFGIKRNIELSYVINLGENAFEDCQCIYNNGSFFYNISLANSQITDIPSNCFKGIRLDNMHYKGTQGIFLPETLLTIGENAFSKCGTVSNLVIPSSVETIGISAFSELTYLSQLSFSHDSALRTINDNAFKGTILGIDTSTLELPEGIETIGKEAFSFKSGLSELIIPTSVKTIGDNVCDRTRVNIIAEEGSYAYFWAIENGYTLSHSDDTSWLTDSSEKNQTDTSWLNE